MPGKIVETMRQKLDRMSIPEPNSGCLLWLGAVNDHGYAVGWWDDGCSYGHRESWIERNGPIPAGLHVCHKCDVPSCVNPDHLFLGTRSDNMRDMVRKKRRRNGGERNGNAKITPAIVIAIRSDDRSARFVAAEYGIGRTTVHEIRAGKRWGHVSE